MGHPKQRKKNEVILENVGLFTFLFSFTLRDLSFTEIKRK